jgi:hypothetical protein
MISNNVVRIGTVTKIVQHGLLATYTLSCGYEWDDGAGMFAVGEKIKVLPLILDLVHVERFAN